MAMQRIFGSGFNVKEKSPTHPKKTKSKKPGFGSAAGNWTVDATKFLDLVENLAKTFVPPLSLGKIFEAEALSVLQLAAKKTKRVKLNKVKGKYNPNNANYNKFVRINGRLYPTKQKAKRVKGRFQSTYSASFRAKIARRMKLYHARALARVGLSKAIYYKMAKDDLNLKGYDRNWAESSMIKKAYAAQYGKKGNATRMRSKGVEEPPPQTSWTKSASGWKMKHNDSIVIKVFSKTLNTLNPHTKGAAEFQKAVNGRVGVFNKNVKKGFFKDSDFLAKQYPNVFVRA